MKFKKMYLVRLLVFIVLVGVGFFSAVSPAQGLNSFLKTWNNAYPDSESGDASCSLCHGSSTSNLNAYGRDLCLAFEGSIPADVTADLFSIEGLNSDADLGGFTNLAEINSGAQPGWTEGLNPVYGMVDANCAPLGVSIPVPSGVPLPYDPVVNGDPVAVPGGPYAGYVGVPLTFDGSASFDSDGGALVSYTWDFGDGFTGEGAVVAHTYATAAIFTVSLTVVDEEGASNTHATTATITDQAVLDLDIAGFTVDKTSSVGKKISPKLSVDNPGPVRAQAIATVWATQNGGEVYRWRLNVYDTPGGKTTTFTFPSYTVVSTGEIQWYATIADVNPDEDLAMATTLVK